MKARKKKKFKEKPMDEIYLPNLKRLVDRLFQEACNLGMEWQDMATRSGLALSTIQNLGYYQTQYPQFRTLQLLAHAVGGHVSFVVSKKAQVFKITWTPESFARRKKAA